MSSNLGSAYIWLKPPNLSALPTLLKTTPRLSNLRQSRVTSTPGGPTINASASVRNLPQDSTRSKSASRNQCRSVSPNLRNPTCGTGLPRRSVPDESLSDRIRAPRQSSEETTVHESLDLPICLSSLFVLRPCRTRNSPSILSRVRKTSNSLPKYALHCLQTQSTVRLLR